MNYISAVSLFHTSWRHRWSPHSASIMVCLMWGFCISLLHLSQVLLGHISPENVGIVEYETRIILFSVYPHFPEDVIIKLTTGMGMDSRFHLGLPLHSFLLTKRNGKHSRLLIFSRLLVSLVKITNITHTQDEISCTYFCKMIQTWLFSGCCALCSWFLLLILSENTHFSTIGNVCFFSSTGSKRVVAFL